MTAQPIDNRTELKLKTIHSLLGESFLIPAYQRGYRWKPQQVKQLLDDIWEFSQKKGKSDNEFYCLQPIVVRDTMLNENRQGWEVIDGQQRITTLRIMLSFLSRDHLRRPLKEAFDRPEFPIHYETRPTSDAFLSNPQDDESNLDYLYIWAAYCTITSWFKDKDFNERNRFLNTLLARTKQDHPVMIIWYKVSDSTDPVDVFTRLNIGKIPLTNAELIKALFLSSAKINNQDQRVNEAQLLIAAEWDRIENTLQDDAFWFFIYDQDNNYLPHHEYDTRIEYVFDLLEKKKDSEEDEYYTFIKFLERLKSSSGSGPKIEDVWLSIKRFFQLLEEWYLDQEFYHLVGYLIATNHDLQEIISKAQDKTTTKVKFRRYLRNRIANKVQVEDIKELDYDKDSNQIRKLLLLANVQTLVANGHTKARFPFDSYKKEQNWDIEHIRSQSEVPLSGKDRQSWAKLVLEYFTGIPWKEASSQEQKKEVEQFSNPQIQSSCFTLLKTIEEDCSEDEFNQLYKNLREVFGEEEIPEVGSLGNLTLLDAGTNRAYKNSFFAVKRMEIIKREKEGHFVPICTKNAFMKAYSRRFHKIMYWSEADGEDYLSAIETLLTPYLPISNQSQHVRDRT